MNFENPFQKKDGFFLDQQKAQETNQKIESQEIQGEQLIEYSQKVGDFYTSLVKNLTKMGNVKTEALNELPDEIKTELKDFTESIDRHSQINHERFLSKEGGVRDLLSSKLTEHENISEELINDRSKYELEEISPGIFVIFMNKELYSKLYGKNVAVSTLDKEGVSFISMQKEYKEKESLNNSHKENLLHETHHIIWSFLLEDKKINIQEDDENMWTAYRFFQDEVIARLCSDQGFMGYSHLLLMDKEKLKEFKEKDFKKEKQINQCVINLNTLMYDEIMPLVSEAGIQKKDLIFSVMRSKNFTDLENNLKKIKSAMEQKAKKIKKSKPQTKSNGWNVIGT